MTTLYTIYETTNNINGKVYIGQHKTNNIDDGYLGSGHLLQSAVKKYGRKSFSKKILHTFGSFEEMDAKEKELVTEDFVNRKDTYNIVAGGYNRAGYMPTSSENHRRAIRESVLHKEAIMRNNKIMNDKKWSPENKVASVKKLREVHMKTFVVINPDMTRHYVTSMKEYTDKHPELNYTSVLAAAKAGKMYKGHKVIIVKESKRNLK